MSRVPRVSSLFHYSVQFKLLKRYLLSNFRLLARSLLVEGAHGAVVGSEGRTRLAVVVGLAVVAAVLHEVLLWVLWDHVPWAGSGEGYGLRGGWALHHSSGATGVEVAEVLAAERLLLVLAGVSWLMVRVLLGGVRVRLILEAVDAGLAIGSAP